MGRTRAPPRLSEGALFFSVTPPQQMMVAPSGSLGDSSGSGAPLEYRDDQSGASRCAQARARARALPRARRGQRSRERARAV